MEDIYNKIKEKVSIILRKNDAEMPLYFVINRFYFKTLFSLVNN